jgi:hypothetical protein
VSLANLKDFVDKKPVKTQEIIETPKEKPKKEPEKKTKKKLEKKVKKEIPKLPEKKPEIKKEDINPTKPEAPKEIAPTKPEPLKEKEAPQENIASPFQMLQEKDKVQEVEELEISNRAKFNIFSQLNGCFYRVFNDLDENYKDEVIIEIELSQEGQISFDKRKNFDISKKDDENYQKIMDSIERAANLCAKFRNLDQSKYEIWHKFKVKLKKK